MKFTYWRLRGVPTAGIDGVRHNSHASYKYFREIRGIFCYSTKVYAGCSTMMSDASVNQSYYRPPEGGRLYDMKVVSVYAFLRTYYV